jgi:hypothetical protein
MVGQWLEQRARENVEGSQARKISRGKIRVDPGAILVTESVLQATGDKRTTLSREIAADIA